VIVTTLPVGNLCGVCTKMEPTSAVGRSSLSAYPLSTLIFAPFSALTVDDDMPPTLTRHAIRDELLESSPAAISSPSPSFFGELLDGAHAQ